MTTPLELGDGGKNVRPESKSLQMISRVARTVMPNSVLKVVDREYREKCRLYDKMANDNPQRITKVEAAKLKAELRYGNLDELEHEANQRQLEIDKINEKIDSYVINGRVQTDRENEIELRRLYAERKKLERELWGLESNINKIKAAYEAVQRAEDKKEAREEEWRRRAEESLNEYEQREAGD